MGEIRDTGWVRVFEGENPEEMLNCDCQELKYARVAISECLCDVSD